MTFVAAIADAHIGNHGPFAKGSVAGINTRCLHGLDVLARVNKTIGRLVRTQLEGEDPVVVSLGDLFDVSTPTPPVIAEVARRLYDLDWRVLLGNHEMASSASGDNALAPLFATADVFDRPKCDDTRDDASILFVPYRPGPAKSWLPEAIREVIEFADKSAPRLLCLHLGISDDETPPWLRDANDQIDAGQLLALMDEHQIDAAVAGNWHTQQVFGGGRILQVGTVCPKSFSDASAFGFPGGYYGSMALWNSEDPRRFQIVPISGPRFIRTRNLKTVLEDVQSENEADPENVLFVRIEVAESELVEARLVRDALLATRMVEGCDVVEVDRKLQDAVKVRQLHAAAAQESGTIEVALERFVSAMSLEVGVDPARVIEIVKGYINGR